MRLLQVKQVWIVSHNESRADGHRRHDDGIIFRIALYGFLTGMSPENFEAAFSHSSQFVQFGLRQRFSVSATR